MVNHPCNWLKQNWKVSLNTLRVLWLGIISQKRETS